MNRSLEAAVIENGPRMMVTDGLAYDHCEVGVVTRLDPARTLTEEYIEDADQLYKVLRTQVDVVLPRGVAVLNAADPMVAQMGPLCDGAVIFFATEADAPEVAAHRGNGGRAVLVRDGRIVLATGDDEVTLADLDRVPLAGAEPPEDGIESVLAAVGAAWALGVPAEILRAGIETFEVPAAAEAVAA
jgi:cyanophycin synthetase